MKIIAYRIETVGDYAIIQRCVNGNYSEFAADTFKDAVLFLTQPQPDTLSVVWDLAQAYKVLYGLLPEETQKKNETASKYWYDDVKVFWVGQMLGLTTRVQIKGNNYDKVEVNLYSLRNWLAEDRVEPPVTEIAVLGSQVLDVLKKWGITPKGLTSPAGVYAKSIQDKMPTVFSNPKIKDAANYCLPVMDVEWTQEFGTSAFAPTFRNDLRSAYPSEMLKLPDTDKCRVMFSKDKMACDWGILRVENMFPPFLHPLTDVERDKYTTEELAWVKKHGGTYTILDGFYLTFPHPILYPYKKMVEDLWTARRDENSGITVLPEVAKRTANGISGKFSQQNKDGGFGELYNPILASMLKSRVRLKDMSFIEEHHLEKELVSVHVDCVKSYMDLNLPEDAGIGEWRQVREKE